MSWKGKKKKTYFTSKNKHYSLSKKLRREKRSSDNFEVILSQLTLEEVIGLKLEMATQSLDGRCFGLPVWRSLHSIVQHAVLKWAISASKTHIEAARFLGISQSEYERLLRHYDIRDYFSFSEETVDKTD